MMKDRRDKFILIFFLILIAILSMTACARKERQKRIVATINDYKMTVDDFNYESKEVLHMGRLLGEMPITKEDVLDALIVKEILLQEAQKENLDKDRDFMKTIELYWEQTLLKNLLSKKSKEIEREIMVYEEELIDYYNKMKNKIRATVLVFDNKKSPQRLLTYAGDIIEYAKREKEKFSLLYIIPSKWYVLGEDDSSLEKYIFDVDSNKDRELVKIDGKWALVIIEERIPSEVEPLPVLRDEIVRRIRMRKEQNLMNKWIDGLRLKAHIKINKKVLSELP